MIVLRDKEDFVGKQVNDRLSRKRKREEGYESSSCVPEAGI